MLFLLSIISFEISINLYKCQPSCQCRFNEVSSRVRFFFLFKKKFFFLNLREKRVYFSLSLHVARILQLRDAYFIIGATKKLHFVFRFVILLSIVPIVFTVEASFLCH